MSGLLLFIAASACAGIVGAEFFGWLMPLARWLVRVGVRQLPVDYRTRYSEEWIGDIERKAEGRNLTALVWALGTCVTANGLAKTLEGSAARDRSSSEVRRWLRQHPRLGLGLSLVAMALVCVFGMAQSSSAIGLVGAGGVLFAFCLLCLDALLRYRGVR